MKNKINKKLLNWVLSIDNNENAFAITYGAFSISKMDFKVFISDDEIEKFDIAVKIIQEKNNNISEDIYKNYYRYIQAHNHELFHYYQALTLPSFNIYQKLSKRKLEFEASIMLRYFEHGCSYILGRDKKILDILLSQSNFKLDNEEIKNFNNLFKKYKYYSELWSKKYQELSLFYIIEGMAHIMSIQLTDNSKNYLSETENKIEYNIAYDVFESHIDEQYFSTNIRIKHLIFLYICYFSCQTFNFPEDKELNKVPKLFYLLCSNINLYFKKFYQILKQYIKYSKDELTKLKYFKPLKQELKLANKDQIAQIYSFFDLVHTIKYDAERHYSTDLSFASNISNEFSDIFKYLKINLNDPLELAKLALFPSKMADLWEAYEKIQKSKIENMDFTNSQEITFYEFVEKCKKILDNKTSIIPCCEFHGIINNKAKILYCQTEGGFAYYIKELTGKNAFELFKIQE